MKLNILKYPDAKLREVSDDVTDFNADLKKLSQDMLETMYAENGIGLAAIQVGVAKRMLVIDASPRDTGGRYEEGDQTPLESQISQPLIVINPILLSGEGSTTFDEGCLSVPSFFETVERKEKIVLQYHNLKGEQLTLETDGLLAIVIQHEMDHLNGELFIDRISFVKSNKIKAQIKKNGYPEKAPKSSEKSESAL